jgi:Ca2+-binding EF-hand superfamily protein
MDLYDRPGSPSGSSAKPDEFLKRPAAEFSSGTSNSDYPFFETPVRPENAYNKLFDDAFDPPEPIRNGTPYGGAVHDPYAAAWGQLYFKSPHQSSVFPETKPAEKNAIESKYTKLGNYTIEDLPALVDRSFHKFDTNHNGYIDAAETNAAIANPKFTEEDALVVAVLRGSGALIQKMSDDEYGTENSGVTRKDFTKLFEDMKSYEKEIGEALDVEKYGLKMFSEIDTDKSGSISEKELNAYKLPPAKQPYDSDSWERKQKEVALASMKRSFHDLKKANTDSYFGETGITERDLERYFAAVYVRHSHGTHVAVRHDFNSAVDNLSRKTTQNLYATKDPLDSIQADAIYQGAIGDCYFVGPLSSMAATPAGRQKIRDMIRDNGAGKDGRHTYTVTFPGSPDRPITVSEPTDSELAMFAGPSKHGLWPAVLEKAYARYENSSSWSYWTYQTKALDYDAIANGSSTRAGHKILSKEYGSETYKLTRGAEEGLRFAIANALKDGRAVSTSALNLLSGPGAADNQTRTNKLYRGHAYAIIGFDPKTDMVTIRNPWGAGGEPENNSGTAKDGKNDGTFVLPLKDLWLDFDNVHTAK